MILDRNKRVLASSDKRGVLNETIALEVDGSGTGSYAKGDVTVGYAATSGYKTCKGLVWYGCLVQTP